MVIALVAVSVLCVALIALLVLKARATRTCSVTIRVGGSTYSGTLTRD